MSDPTVRDRVLLLAGAEVGLIAVGVAIIGWRGPGLPAISILPPLGYAWCSSPWGCCRACTSSSGGTRSN